MLKGIFFVYCVASGAVLQSFAAQKGWTTKKQAAYVVVLCGINGAVGYLAW